MKNFTNISKKKIIEAIGPLTITALHTTVLDKESSGCFACPDYYHNSSCVNCQRATYKPETIYRYEHKKMNMDNQLPLNAIKLYCYIHFFIVNGRGWVIDFDVAKAADALYCCRQTIQSSLTTLAQKGYILVCQGNATNLYTIFVTDYERMYDTADKGGCGYFAMSKQLLDTLAACNSLTTMRCFFRLWDILSHKDAVSQATVCIPLKDIYACFPNYITRHHITEALENLSNVFITQHNKGYITCTMVPEYNSQAIKRSSLNNATIEITNKCNHMRQAVDQYNTIKNSRKNRNNKKLDLIKDELIKSGIRIPSSLYSLQPINPSDKDIRDMIQMSVEYNPDLVLTAYIYVYNEILQTDADNITNLGGLIRTVIREWLEWPLYQAA